MPWVSALRAVRMGTLMIAIAAVGCGERDDDDHDDDHDGPGSSVVVYEHPEDVCRPDNPWFPLPVGRETVFEGEEDGAQIHLVITVLDETEDVGGVLTRVMKEHEEEDGELVEESWNYFAQAEDGTVCYFGEAVDIYEDGELANHDGAWRAEGDNRPGIVMPGDPAVGMSYPQELAPSIAEDHADHIAMGRELEVPATGEKYTDTLEVREWTPLEPDATSEKTYARGVGLVRDGTVYLVSDSGG
jgi:hypothetical protein